MTFLNRLTVVLCLWSSSSALAATTVLPAPCDPKNQEGGFLRPCSKALTSQGGQANLLDLIRKRVQQQVDAYYGLYTPTPGAQPTYHSDGGVELDPLEPPGQKIGSAVCNVLESPFVKKGGAPFAEIREDHFGKSCGTPIDIQVSISVPEVAGCAAGDPTITVNLGRGGGKGTVEDSYSWGGAIAAMTCFFAAAEREIQSKNQFTVSDINGAPSACAAAAKDTAETLASVLADGKKVHTSLKRPIAECSKAGTGQVDDQLCGSQQSLEMAFVETVSCQILAQAQAGFLNNVYGERGHKKFYEFLQPRVSKPCTEECKKRFYKSSSVCHKVPKDSQVSECVNQCYQRGLPDLVRDFFNSLWPAGGSCQTDLRHSRGTKGMGFAAEEATHA